MSRVSFILGPTGTPFRSAGGNVFEKDVLVEGEYQHPISPWDEPLRATKEYIEAVCANTNAALAAGQRTYIPDGHSSKARDNTGYAAEFRPAFRDGKWRAVSRLTIEDPAYVPKIGTTIKDVSPMIVNFPLGDGKGFGERFEHIALVSDPVMPGQGDFVACSLRSGTIETVEVPVLKPVPSLGVNAMKIKVSAKNVKALSLAGVTAKDGDEIEVTAEQFERALSVADAAAQEAQKAKDAQKTAEDALVAEKAKPALTVVKMLSVDPAAAFFKEARTSGQKALSATLDAAMSKGRINATMRARLEKILAVRHGYALSESGVAESVDVVAEAEALLASIPDQAVVPVGERALPAGGKPEERPANTGDAFDTPEKVKAEADRILTRAGMKSATK